VKILLIVLIGLGYIVAMFVAENVVRVEDVSAFGLIGWAAGALTHSAIT
jgi:hypothetical protein